MANDVQLHVMRCKLRDYGPGWVRRTEGGQAHSAATFRCCKDGSAAGISGVPLLIEVGPGVTTYTAFRGRAPSVTLSGGCPTPLSQPIPAGEWVSP